jgi:phospholipase/carboxylesterase
MILAVLVALGSPGCKRADAEGDRVTRASHGLSHRVVGSGDRAWVVVLHGYGARGDDLVPLAARIAREANVRCAVVEAPIAMPGGGRAWWPFDVARIREERARGENRLRERAPEGLAAARARVIALVEELRETGPGTPEIHLVGFSQGAMLAADVALHLEPPPDGVAVLSGTFVTADEWTARMAARPAVEVLVAHGRSDPILPFEWARELADEWSRHARSARFVPFDGGHAVPREVGSAVVEMIR